MSRPSSPSARTCFHTAVRVTPSALPSSTPERKPPSLKSLRASNRRDMRGFYQRRGVSPMTDSAAALGTGETFGEDVVHRVERRIDEHASVGVIIVQAAAQRGMQRGARREVGPGDHRHIVEADSYTHLTLPTICSV